MRVEMELLSDAVFGNGMSVPGGEDISVLSDIDGFPYYKGGTFKGIFREELGRYLTWTDNLQADQIIERLLGNKGSNDSEDSEKIVFSDFVISEAVREAVICEIGDNKQAVLDSMTNIRVFTSITQDGISKEGSLRMARCVNKGLVFYSDILCKKEDEEIIKEVLPLIKWVGSMRNRGFGNVKITVE